jgi:pSer/pThr/pTyr-binding forkhead associated (FHA) protein
MQIRLSWVDPTSGERREPLLNTPIALGREFLQLPTKIKNRRASRIQLNDDLVAEFHALLVEENGLLTVIDQDSPNGLNINNQPQLRGYLHAGDWLSIGNLQILVSQIGPATSISKILFSPITDIREPHLH